MNVARLILLAALVPTGVCLAAVADNVPERNAPGHFLEDVPGELEPLRPRAEVDEDRSSAAARVAVGRLHYQREQPRPALQCFQRAFRFDANSISVLSDIVPLQLALNRHDEAARYAVIGAQQQSTDTEMMRRLALFLTENLDFEGALQLYQRSVNLNLEAESDSKAALLVEMGRLYYLTQQFEEAAKVFDVVLPALRRPEKYGIDGRTHERILGRAELTFALIGETFLEVGRGEDAAELFHKSNEAQEDPERLAFRLARVAAQAEDDQAAIGHLQEYFDAKSDGEGSRPYELLRDVLANLEPAPESLLDRLKDLRQNDPANTELAYFLADQLRSANRLDEAIDLYRQTLEASADIRGYLGVADILRQREQVSELLDVLGQVTSQLGTLEALGDQAAQIVKNQRLLDAVIQAGLAAVEEDAAGPPAGARLACALLALKAERLEQADELFDLATVGGDGDQAETTLVWILELFAAGQYGRASDLLQQAIDNDTVDTSNPYVFFLLAGACEMDSRTDQALQAARKAVELQPDMSQWHSREAWILYHAGRYDEAYDKYKSLITEFDDDHSSTQRRKTLRDARFVLSNVAVVREDFDAAEEWLEQVLDEFPADIGALNDLGYLYADREKHLQRSLRMVRRAVKAEPDNMAYQDSVGWTLHKLGRHDDALAYLEQATGQEHPDGIILDHLGDVYWHLDRRQQALETWGRAASALEQSENETMREKVATKIDQRKQAVVDGPVDSE